MEHGVQYSQASDDRYIYFMERMPETVPTKYEEVMQTFKSLLKGKVFEMKFFGEIDPDLDEYHAAMELLAQKYRFRYDRKARHG